MAPATAEAAGSRHPVHPHPHCCACACSPRCPAAMVTGAHQEALFTQMWSPLQKLRPRWGPGCCQAVRVIALGTLERHKEGHSFRHPRAQSPVGPGQRERDAQRGLMGVTSRAPSLHSRVHSVHGRLQGRGKPLPLVTAPRSCRSLHPGAIVKRGGGSCALGGLRQRGEQVSECTSWRKWVQREERVEWRNRLELYLPKKLAVVLPAPGTHSLGPPSPLWPAVDLSTGQGEEGKGRGLPSAFP